MKFAERTSQITNKISAFNVYVQYYNEFNDSEYFAP